MLEWLDGAAKAAHRARRDPSDVGALHRFRVNARRLVVNIKAVENRDGIPAKLRKRLRRALRATGPWRDGHVETLWLDDYARLPRARAHGATALAKALSRDWPRASAKPGWWRKIERTLKKMRRALEAAPLKGKELFAARGEAAEKEWRTLAPRLRGLDRVRDRPTLHEARIAVRKLRYLLEAMETAPRGLPTPAALRGLQTALGEAHDRDMIAADIAAAGRAAALKLPARHALERLKREKSARLLRAGRLCKPLLEAREEIPRRGRL